jgi:hypothetical protein
MEKFSDSDSFETPKTATVLSSWYGLLNIPDWSWYWGCVFSPYLAINLVLSWLGGQ